MCLSYGIVDKDYYYYLVTKFAIDIFYFTALLFILVWSLSFLPDYDSFYLFMYLTQDVNKSGKNFQMIKIRFFSLLVHKNLIQYDEEWW